MHPGLCDLNFLLATKEGASGLSLSASTDVGQRVRGSGGARKLLTVHEKQILYDTVFPACFPDGLHLSI